MMLTKYTVRGNTFRFQHADHIKPTKKQILSVAFHLENAKSFNFNDLGLGKTLTALAVADNYMLQHPGTQTLVLSKLSTLESVWLSHIATHMRSQGGYHLLDSRKSLKAFPKTKANFIIGTHDIITSGAMFVTARLYVNDFSEALFDRVGKLIVIVDEATAYRNSRSNRSRIFRHLAKRAPVTVMMTATPRPHSAMDAHGLKVALDPSWRVSQTDWRDLTMHRVSETKWLDNDDANDLCFNILQPQICYRREIDDLPPCLPAFRKSVLNKEQQHAYQRLKQEAVFELAGSKFTVMAESAVRTKILQTLAGYVYDNDRKVHKFVGHERLPLLHECMNEYPGKWIILAPFRATVNAIAEYIKNQEHVSGGQFKVAEITGETPLYQRSAIFKDYENNPHGINAIVADPTTIAYGLTLLACKSIIWYAPTDRSEIWQQANARHHRTGQDSTTYVVMVYAHQLEKDIYERKIKNIAIQGELLQMLEMAK